MSNTEKVEEILRTGGNPAVVNTHLREVLDFYQRMVDLGLFKRPTYTLPPLDTIGRGWYQKQALRRPMFGDRPRRNGNDGSNALI